MKKQSLEFRRELRQNSTNAERKLWKYLRDRGLNKLKFRRQHSIGPYTVDFYCHEKKLVLELDGGGHSGSVKDKVRDEYMRKNGITVVRIWNNDALGNTYGVRQHLVNVIEEIDNIKNRPSPRPFPLKQGEGGLSSRPSLSSGRRTGRH